MIQTCSSDVSAESCSVRFLFDILVVALRASTYLSQLGTTTMLSQPTSYTSMYVRLQGNEAIFVN